VKNKLLKISLLILILQFFLFPLSWIAILETIAQELGIDVADTTFRNIGGVLLDDNFSSNGRFVIPITVNTTNASPPLDYADRAREAIALVTCTTDNPNNLCCSCDGGSTVGTLDDNLDVAIDIDSSGSNVDTDPDNLRLVAAQQIVETLLNGNNRVAAFNFGPDSYCAGPPCPEGAIGDFFRNLTQLSGAIHGGEGVTYRFSDGYVGVSEKETIQNNISLISRRSSGGTPLFESLLEIMDDMSVSITRNSTKMIVLFSDGVPGTRDQEAVCSLASEMDVRIITIGYGEASTEDPTVDEEAVQVLQNLAECSGGTYLAIQNVNLIAEEVEVFFDGSFLQDRLDVVCTLTDPQNRLATLEEPDTVEGNLFFSFSGIEDAKILFFNFTPPSGGLTTGGGGGIGCPDAQTTDIPGEGAGKLFGGCGKAGNN